MGTTTMKTKCSVFKLPKDESDKQTSLNVLPQRNGFQINPAKFFICERHRYSLPVKLPGAYSRPALPSSVFNRHILCLPTPKPAAKKLKQEDVQLKYFMEKDTIRSINEFDPEKGTAEKYSNVVTPRQKYEIVYIFMTQVLLSTEEIIILYYSQCW